jgi:hypothetical protein
VQSGVLTQSFCGKLLSFSTPKRKAPNSPDILLPSYLPTKCQIQKSVIFKYTFTNNNPLVEIISLDYHPDVMDRDSKVGIATRYGFGGPGIESRWGEVFRFRPDRPWGPPSLLYSGYRVTLPGVNRSGGVVLTSHPRPASRLRK